jgi:hypothetical protein
MRAAVHRALLIAAVGVLFAACEQIGGLGDMNFVHRSNDGGSSGVAGASGGGAAAAAVDAGGSAGTAQADSEPDGPQEASEDASGTAGSAGSGGAGATGGAAGAMGTSAKIIFLHHATGGMIWEGGVPGWFDSYNAAHSTTYDITAQDFPKDTPYGWENYPYDYWNIWVNHAGSEPYLTEPTLEILTQGYDVIVFKHCYPVSSIDPDTGSPSVDSDSRTLGNYKLQYDALKTKLLTFPSTRFIVWTGAASSQSDIDAAHAARAKEFFDWVKAAWDEKGDNIFVWDFWQLETEGGLYLTDANSAGGSAPNSAFAQKVAPWFAQRVVDVIEGRGDSGNLTGQQ